MRPQPRALRPLTPAGSTSVYGLPPELLRTAVQRAGFLGLLIALMAPAGYWIERFTQPQRVAATAVFPPLVAGILLVAGGALCALAWSGRARAELVLDVSLLFEVVVAFGISLSENATPWPPGPIRGISWNCLWISLFVVTIPASYGKMVLAAAAAACMGPFGLLLAHVVNGNPMPTGEQLLILLLPPFAAAGWAIPAGRHLYHLGAQVSRARAIGSYELLELIGQGGMGEVWRARHRMLAREAALKVIRPEVLGAGGDQGQVILHRFEREARATAALRSPHTVVLYDYGLSGEASFYYAMELLDGTDLHALVARYGPLPAGRVVHVLRQAAKSLAEAHEHGLVHRDIKPRNIFLCRMGTDHDFVKVLDFGLVKIRYAEETQTTLTGTGITTGTPAYMAPEIAMGSFTVDGRADLYSLGCVGYWLLTGQQVFEAPNSMAMMLAHVQSAPVPPSRRAAVPPSLDRVILSCLEKDPARRVGSARELAAALLECGDVTPWTERDAESWWQAHMPRAAAASGSGS